MFPQAGLMRSLIFSKSCFFLFFVFAEHAYRLGVFPHFSRWPTPMPSSWMGVKLLSPRDRSQIEFATRLLRGRVPKESANLILPLKGEGPGVPQWIVKAEKNFHFYWSPSFTKWEQAVMLLMKIFLRLWRISSGTVSCLDHLRRWKGTRSLLGLGFFTIVIKIC